MKKISFFLLIFCCIISCSKKESNLVINGKVQGLKKGVLYLQKIEDTSLITIDSLIIEGNPAFTFETFIESPQVLYLYLNKVDNSKYDDRILFFAEPGEMTVFTSLENFKTDAVVEGSKNQQKLAEYQQMIDRFNSQNLDFIKANLEAQQESNDSLALEISKKRENLLKRRYLFTVNFALNNKNLELAPYLAVSEIYDANIKYLDTIYSALTPEVKTSKYGKDLEEFLEERRNLAQETEKIIE